ncbi:MAG: tRNA pseudouridine(13) synthase TruD [Candidatus Omnitrophica bacterium]|nr:tRNA pseudouridine(13) synthase TruD [Candidatus Omnitrophota bacterium]
MSCLPYLTSSIPAVSATFKQNPSDFIVEEIPAYLPQGVGEHCYLFIEKEKIPTHDMVRVLARELRVREGEIGVAGLKDAQAIARQWVSVRLLPEAAANAFSHPQIRILKISRHGNKLRIGHLKGNRFVIRLRNVSAHDVPRIREALDILERRGVPNYFGEQRFGRNNDTHVIGRAILEGSHNQHHPRKMNFFYMSAYQSHIFNLCLAKRLETFDRLFPGDLAAKHENGAVFRVENAEAEQLRVERFEISPTGPLFGSKMMEPEAVEQDLEVSVLAEEGVSRDLFVSPFRDIELTGDRRPYRFPIRELGISYTDEVLELSFFLPKGCYATAVLREILKDS